MRKKYIVEQETYGIPGVEIGDVLEITGAQEGGMIYSVNDIPYPTQYEGVMWSWKLHKWKEIPSVESELNNTYEIY